MKRLKKISALIAAVVLATTSIVNFDVNVKTVSAEQQQSANKCEIAIAVSKDNPVTSADAIKDSITVHPGDSFYVTVMLTKNEGITNGTIKLDYDNNCLEIADGEKDRFVLENDFTTTNRYVNSTVTYNITDDGYPMMAFAFSPKTSTLVNMTDTGVLFNVKFTAKSDCDISESALQSSFELAFASADGTPDQICDKDGNLVQTTVKTAKAIVDHTWGAETVKTPANCQSGKVTTKTCTHAGCKATLETIGTEKDFTNHTCTPVLVGNSEATHLKDGNTGHYVCGSDRTVKITNYKGHEDDKVISKDTNNHHKQIVQTKDVCWQCDIKEGSETCGYKETAHTYGAWEVTKEATCKEKGSKKQVCSVCGYQNVQEIPINPANHANKEPTLEGFTAATHTTPGNAGKFYWACCNASAKRTDGYTDNQVIPADANAHTWIYNTAADRKAGQCGHCETDGCTAIKTTHNYDTTSTAAHCKVCKDCGYEVEHIKVAGGTADAHSKCSTCGWVIEDGAKHSFSDWTVTKAPTCTAKGEETRTCTCGYKETREVVALGHNLVATDASDLSVCKKCDREGCNYIEYHKEVEKGGKSDVHSTCSVCNRVLSTEHTYTEEVVKQPTCTVDGQKKLTCKCGYVDTTSDATVIPKLGHLFTFPAVQTADYCKICTRCKEETIAHTPVHGGTEAIHEKCSVCNYIISATHTMVKNTEKSKEATCTEDGLLVMSCDCGYEVGTTIKASHKFDSVEINKDGTIKRVCTVCGEEVVSKIPTADEKKNDFIISGVGTYTEGDTISVSVSDVSILGELSNPQYGDVKYIPYTYKINSAKEVEFEEGNYIIPVSGSTVGARTITVVYVKATYGADGWEVDNEATYSKTGIVNVEAKPVEKPDAGSGDYDYDDDDDDDDDLPVNTSTITSDNTGANPVESTVKTDANGDTTATVKLSSNDAAHNVNFSKLDEQAQAVIKQEFVFKLTAGNGVIPKNTTIEISKVVTGKDYNNAKEVTKYVASKIAVFDINLVNQNDVKIQPNGKLSITTDLPTKFNPANVAVFRLSSDGKSYVELPTTVAGGKITFETDHFSVYVIAEKSATTVNSPKTGDSHALPMMLFIMMISAGALLITYKRFRV